MATAEALAAAAARGDEPSRCGFDLSRSVLLAVREDRLIRPDLVVKFGDYLLNHHKKRLGQEIWALYEQMCIALLQYGKSSKAKPEAAKPDYMRRAQECCNILSAQFPESLRIKRLEGMMWEAKGDLDEAMKEYEIILQEDPNNLFAMKRQVALLRARGRMAEASRRLTDHLAIVCSDADSWLQLCDLYLSQQQYRKATFCMEELILLNPMAYIYHVRYGEILFTIGSAERGGNAEVVRTARKYFAHALELKPQGNLRALYGLLLCCAATGKGSKARGDAAELAAFAQQTLLQEYEMSALPSPWMKVVEGMIKTLLS
eukprot:CAMPEP_0119336922 /NCGR_PEP_ID=MMETSP1333-20130426/92931_1 /TAXON_ID=418940 /ORGANISM="Scyphosphaera apsteinii, Strain RCC1455" /LENGTH=316 /DNA_ID=CAMNT_0007347857 /DNA_START=23 /DNA_END=973 /DNA_ORIENTATION=+